MTLAALSFFIFAAVKTAGGQSPAPAVPDFPTSGAIECAGAPAPVLCLSDHSWPIAAGWNTDGRTVSPVAACAEYGKGRVVVFGHPDFLTTTAPRRDTKKVVDWAIEWAGGKPKPKVARSTRVEHADVIVVVGEPEDPKEMLKFVKAGGGVVMGALPWAWKQFRERGGLNSNLAVNYPGNRFLAPAGLLLCDMSVAGNPAGGGNTLGFAFPECSSPLKAIFKAAKGKFASEAEKEQAARALVQAVDALPPDTPGWSKAFANLAKSPLASKLPSPAKPLGPDDWASRCAIVFRKNLWQSDPSAKIDPDPAAAVYPGPCKSGAKSAPEVVTIDASTPRWHSTGLYAPPGAQILVETPAGIEKKGFGVRVGTTADDLTASKGEWMRAPLVTVTVPLDARKTTVASPFGGFIYLVVPGGHEVRTPVKLRVSGALKAPHFVLGKTTNAEWGAMVKAAVVPQVELESKGLVVTMPLKAARAVKDPEGVMKFWAKAMEWYDEFLGEMNPAQSAERVCCDVQISLGYLHSGYPVMAPIDAAGAGAFENPAKLKKEGAWGIFHELGHNRQKAAWTWNGMGEVSVNFFSLYLTGKMCGLKARDAFGENTSKAHGERVVADWVRSGRNYDALYRDPFLALEFFLRLIDAYGEDVIAKTLRSYTASDNPGTDEEKVSLFAEKASKAANANIAAAMKAWGFPVSAAALSRSSSYPAAEQQIVKGL